MASWLRSSFPFITYRGQTVTQPSEFEAQRILGQCQCVEQGNDESPAIYTLPLTTIYKHEGQKLQKFEIDLTRMDADWERRRHQARIPKISEKVIMAVGATGTGKTTTLNGLINYVLGVQWVDPFRFKLMNEMSSNQGFEGVGDQSQSQTQYVSTYTLRHIPGFAVPYTLTVVDTPGFGDTRGIEQDKKVVEQIRTFFNTRGMEGIDQVDAICFIVQAGNPRLTHTQQYVFDSILAMFGKDIKENILVLFTFADGHKPQARPALLKAGILGEKDPSFKFNNSALFAANRRDNNNDGDDDDDDGNFDEMFWEMGIKSFKRFFSHLGKAVPKSLVLTKQVLDERANVEIRVSGLQNKMNEGVSLLSRLKQEERIFNQHAADINANKNFKYTVYEDHRVAIDLETGTYVTNCVVCNFTCHYPCLIPSSENKNICAAMSGEHCTVCLDGCHWTKHVNDQVRYETVRVPVEKEFADVRQRYNLAVHGHNQLLHVIKEHTQEFNKTQDVVLVFVAEMQRSLQKLSEIALKKDPLQQVDYINIMIQSEKNQAKEGWEDRVSSLMETRKKAEQIDKSARPDYDPWEEYKENDKTKNFFKDTCSKLAKKFSSMFFN